MIGAFSELVSSRIIIDRPVFKLMQEFIGEQHLDIDLMLLKSPDRNGRDVSHVYEFWEHVCSHFQVEPTFIGDDIYLISDNLSSIDQIFYLIIGPAPITLLFIFICNMLKANGQRRRS
ncbi:MAG: hypothetical protein DI535_03815 [Citrobacter freundii]|nr:MAG: hypothetical protein DI535_03815 [Citrobacter freundii]